MKLRLLVKVVAVLMFIFGVLTFVSARLKKTEEQPKSFVITYVVTRSENGRAPVATGLIVKTVSAGGEWKQTKVRRLDDEYREQVSIRFLDKTAAYKLEDTRLDYVGASESELERDKIARTSNWVTGSTLFVGEASMLGLKVYTTHQNLNDGWVEQAFSPLTRSTPLLYREHSGNVETTEEAVSIQFRDVSPDEIKPPDLPISFEWSKRLEKAMLSNSENADTVKRAIAEREAVTEKLRTLGRIE
jgi:hypothetical protein